MRIVLSFLIAAGLSAQDVDLRACRPSVEVQRDLNGIPLAAPLAQLEAAFFAEQKPRLEALARKYPRDIFVQPRYVRFLREGVRRDRSGSRAIANLYRFEWEKARMDPLSRYLLAEAVRLRYSESARALLAGLVKEYPEFPWAHFALAELHREYTQASNNRAAEHAIRFVQLCPDSPEGFELLRGLKLSPVEAGLQVIRLRMALEAMPWEVRLQWMPTLWDLEMQGLGAEARAGAVRGVAQDFEEILALGRADRAEWFEALEAAANITGDVERAAWANGEIRKRRAVEPKTEFYSTGNWRRDNAPSSGAEWPVIQAYYRRALAESEKWISRWPNLEQAWQKRLEAATGLDDLPAETVMAIGDAALAVRERAVDDYYRPELRYDVARMYLKHGVRLDEAAALARQPLEDELELRRTEMAEDPAGPPSEKARRYFEENWPRMLQRDVWASMVLMAQLAWRQGDETALVEVVFGLGEKAPAGPEASDYMRMEQFARQTTELHRAEAWLADLRGDVEAAKESYSQAIGSRPVFSGDAPSSSQGDPYFGDAVREEARRYWRKAGAADEEFLAETGGLTGVVLSRSGDAPVWFKALPRQGIPGDFSVTDLTGRVWTKETFLGRPGVLVIWHAKYPWFFEYIKLLEGGLGERTPMLVLGMGGNAAVFEQIVTRTGLKTPVAPIDTPLGLKLSPADTSTIWIVDARGKLVKHTFPGGLRQRESVLRDVRQALEEAR